LTAELRAALRTSDFDYHLPPELIAQFPTERRGESRLLVVPRSGGRPVGKAGSREAARRSFAAGPPDLPTDWRFPDLAELIPPGDLLVLNSTRVRHARLLGRRASGAPAEILLIHPDAQGSWVALGKPGSALQPGKLVELGEGMLLETLEVLETGYRRVRFLGGTAELAMARLGRLPLPPYIDREPVPEDDDRYQTVFAEREGSVAAPTAGLHFTPELLHQLAAKGVRIAQLDLEVGPGTFRPVEVEDYRQHPMHPERYEIPVPVALAVAEARARGAAVWAVGTTVVRALESAVNHAGRVTAGPGETRLMIAPGYRFRVVDRLLTNFHLPRSTLLLLVAAFAGYAATLAAYQTAIERRYRFYSYGDAMAIL
jgi:S-adenosylmethionine:tRNA ribosyltransferase-isomerase